MKKKVAQKILITILILFSFSQIIVLSNFNNPSYQSYYGMRQVEEIKQTGIPLIHDELSYQGRTYSIDFFIYYFIALISFIIPLKILFIYGGIIINLVILILTYNISNKLYSKKSISLLVVTFATLTSVLFKGTLATINSTSIFIIIYLLLIKYFFKIESNPKYIYYFIGSIILGTILDSLMLSVICGLIVYLLLLKLENLKLRTKELELLGFSSLFTIWYNSIIFRGLFQEGGIKALWNNIPKSLLSEFFQKISLPILVSLIGIIPFFFGIYAMYQSLFVMRRRYLLVITSITISLISLLSLGLIPLTDGLLLTTINLIILSGFAIKQLDIYFNKMNFSKIKYFLIILIILFSSINLFYSLQNTNISSPSDEKINLLKQTNFSQESTILANVEEGQFISYITNRKTFYDSQFIKAPNSQQRYLDAKKMFQSKSETTIISLLDYYNIKYIYISPLTRNWLNGEHLLIEEDSKCFKEINTKDKTTIYEVKCSLSK